MNASDHAHYAAHMRGEHRYTDPSWHKATIAQALRKPIAEILGNGRFASKRGE